MESKPITPKQIQLISTLIHKQGLSANKPEIMESFSNGRTSSTKGLTIEEASELIGFLTKSQSDVNVSSRLMKKLFAMAFEMGWCPSEKVIGPDGQIKEKRNYSRLHAWVEKYGFGKKPLRSYTYNELPKLVSVFEEKIYNPYISNLQKGEAAPEAAEPF